MATEDLQGFLARLQTGPAVASPQEAEKWHQHVQRISTPRQIVKVNRDQFDYWLEVLPPRWMRGAAFCFAEGEEPFRLFWQKEQSYFCRQLTCEETLQFCNLSGIPAPFITPEDDGRFFPPKRKEDRP